MPHIAKARSPFVTKGDFEYLIIREVFIPTGNTGWTYETLAGGFNTEQEAKSALPEYQ